MILFFAIFFCAGTLVNSYAQNEDTSITYDTLREAIPNHNINSNQRINLVFNIVNTKEYNINKLIQKNLVDLIGWNGPILSLNYENEPSIKRGFFASDPIRNYKNKFNVWVRYEKNEEVDNSQEYKALENKVVIRVSKYKLSSASFWNEEVSKNSTPFILMGGEPDRISLNSSWAYVLTHELGHALFSFVDEYESVITYRNDYFFDDGASSTIDQIYQNIQNNKKCVNDFPIKPKYFNQLDSMYDEVIQDYKNLGIEKSIKKEDYEVTYYKKSLCSGKYSLDDINNMSTEGSTVFSIMEGLEDSNYNIWGSLKRAEIEKFLGQYNGAGEVIPYQKKEFSRADYDAIKGKKYSDLYPENNKMVQKAFYSYQEEVPKQIPKSFFDIHERLIGQISQYLFGIGVIILLFKLVNFMHNRIISKLKK